jgi:hypothetical protein
MQLAKAIHDLREKYYFKNWKTSIELYLNLFKKIKTNFKWL